MKYILKIEEAGTHFITDEDLDTLVDDLDGIDPKLKGKTLREALRVDLDDSLGFKKLGYHKKMIESKLIWKYQAKLIK